MKELEELARTLLTKVKRSGAENIMAVCPFHRRADGHEEQNPSFALSITLGVYYCHSCHERGSLRTFLQKMGQDAETHRFLLDEVAQNRPATFDPMRAGPISEEPLNESLLGCFEKCPIELLDEGFSEATLAAFDVGVDDWHQRITYPLRDIEGTLVGISGRSTNGERPRYKVYQREFLKWDQPERHVRKSGLLWNGHAVKAELLRRGEADVVVVEGFKACMWLAQAGIRNTVALLGSFMSQEQRMHIEWLCSYGATIHLMLDNDAPGRSGQRAAAATLARATTIYIVDYDAPQPSDLTEDEVFEALAGSKDYYRWTDAQTTTLA